MPAWARAACRASWSWSTANHRSLAPRHSGAMVLHLPQAHRKTDLPSFISGGWLVMMPHCCNFLHATNVPMASAATAEHGIGGYATLATFRCISRLSLGPGHACTGLAASCLRLY